jgi:hypothetical protein
MKRREYMLTGLGWDISDWRVPLCLFCKSGFDGIEPQGKKRQYNSKQLEEELALDKKELLTRDCLLFGKLLPRTTWIQQ